MTLGLNKIMLIGNLGKDPEIRYTQSGVSVCNMNIGVNERKKEGDDWKNNTEWFNIICFGKTAENSAKFLKKGGKIYVDGRIQSRKWKDQNGNDRTTYEVIGNKVLFLGSNTNKNEEIINENKFILKNQDTLNKQFNIDKNDFENNSISNKDNTNNDEDNIPF